MIKFRGEENRVSSPDRIPILWDGSTVQYKFLYFLNFLRYLFLLASAWQNAPVQGDTLF